MRAEPCREVNRALIPGFASGSRRLSLDLRQVMAGIPPGSPSPRPAVDREDAVVAPSGRPEAVGQEVVVTAKAKLSPDGELRDPVAIRIDEAMRVADLVDDFDSSFGRFKADFADPEVQEVLRNLRGEPL